MLCIYWHWNLQSVSRVAVSAKSLPNVAFVWWITSFNFQTFELRQRGKKKTNQNRTNVCRSFLVYYADFKGATFNWRLSRWRNQMPCFAENRSTNKTSFVVALYVVEFSLCFRWFLSKFFCACHGNVQMLPDEYWRKRKWRKTNLCNDT